MSSSTSSQALEAQGKYNCGQGEFDNITAVDFYDDFQIYNCGVNFVLHNKKNSANGIRPNMLCLLVLAMLWVANYCA